LKQTGEQGDPKEQVLGHTKTWHGPTGFPSFKRILVAYDGMQMSKRALGYAAYISKISDSEIVIVNVIEQTRGLNSVLPVTIKTNLESREEEQLDIVGNNQRIQLDEALQEIIKETTAVCKTTGMTKNIIYEIRAGSPADEIINVSTIMDFDLIVMGSRRIASSIEGIGSTTKKVATTIKTPLLIVQKQPRYKDEW
jgi:nucleotide-binding universal stress UspA family protein